MNTTPQNQIKRKRSQYPLILNKALKIVDINRIDIYSAKKIKTNDTELYSVLKPLTNSDSPSAKSKGERLVSANEVTTRISITANKNLSRGESLSLFRSY